MSKALKWLAAAGCMFASIGAQACPIVVWDEPTMPQSMIK